MRRMVAGVLACAVLGCSGGDDAGGGSTPGGTGGSGGTSSSGTSGGTNSGGSGGAGNSGGSAGSAGGGFLPLPGASREYQGVLNLVDEVAYQELETFMLVEQGPTPVGDPHPLKSALNLFFRHYVEQYDFVFFLADHELPTNTVGKFKAVNRVVMPGTGHDVQFTTGAVETNGRVKGAIGGFFIPGGFGPFAHEIMHYWAVELDESFGFGLGLTKSYAAHWGYSGVHGQLGGFDPATLECEEPAGAVPPDCTALASGRVRYRIGGFGPNTNGISQPFAPFELYLMGLAPLSEAPPEIPMLREADLVDNGYDAATDTMIVEAAAVVDTVTVSSIVERHGMVTELPEAERKFSAVFVVVSATPTTDAVLAEVADYAAAFGNRGGDPAWPSFEGLTGGRATLDTTLGPRHMVGDPAPVVPTPSTCDLIDQDCAAGSGCYLNGQDPYCALEGKAQIGEPCQYDSDCVMRATCVIADDDTSSCLPYCDPAAGTPFACASLCSDYIILVNSSDEILAGRCLAL